MTRTSPSGLFFSLAAVGFAAATCASCAHQGAAAIGTPESRVIQLRRALAREYSTADAVALAEELMRVGKTRQAERLLCYIRCQADPGNSDMRACALLAECCWRQGRLADCTLALREMLETYPDRRAWVEANFDAVTRRVSKRAARLQTSADDRQALINIAQAGLYPGPLKVLCLVYQRQLHDDETAVSYRLHAACAERALVRREQAEQYVRSARIVVALLQTAVSHLSSWMSESGQGKDGL